MAEMFWTRQLPTGPGWYWWRNDISYLAQVVNVMQSGEVLEVGRLLTRSIPEQGGEWYGPLVQPSGGAIEDCSTEVQARLHALRDNLTESFPEE